MDDLTFIPANTITITLSSEGYSINTSISTKVSDKTFQQLLSRATYAERYIRASMAARSGEEEIVLEITEDE